MILIRLLCRVGVRGFWGWGFLLIGEWGVVVGVCWAGLTRMGLECDLDGCVFESGAGGETKDCSSYAEESLVRQVHPWDSLVSVYRSIDTSAQTPNDVLIRHYFLLRSIRSIYRSSRFARRACLAHVCDCAAAGHDRDRRERGYALHRWPAARGPKREPDVGPCAQVYASARRLDAG